MDDDWDAVVPPTAKPAVPSFTEKGFGVASGGRGRGAKTVDNNGNVGSTINRMASMKISQDAHLSGIADDSWSLPSSLTNAAPVGGMADDSWALPNTSNHAAPSNATADDSWNPPSGATSYSRNDEPRGGGFGGGQRSGGNKCYKVFRQ